MESGSERSVSRAAGRRRGVAIVLAAAFAACAGHRAGERPLADLAAGRMVEISGGTFLLGSPTGPTHQVVTYERVGTFLLDVTEVTVAAYGECVRAGRCKPAGKQAVFTSWDPNSEGWSAFCNGDRADRGAHPVNCVDWDQAAAYCEWAGKRLPTEPEWEWAARNGGEGTAYPWGNEPPTDRACWNGEGNDAGRGKRTSTCAAGSHPADASRSGVMDLGGGVWEWTSSEQVLGADSRGRGGSTGRVARGGSWADTDPRDLVAWRRIEDLPGRRDPRLGFRCASNR